MLIDFILFRHDRYEPSATPLLTIVFTMRTPEQEQEQERDSSVVKAITDTPRSVTDNDTPCNQNPKDTKANKKKTKTKKTTQATNKTEHEDDAVTGRGGTGAVTGRLVTATHDDNEGDTWSWNWTVIIGIMTYNEERE